MTGRIKAVVEDRAHGLIWTEAGDFFYHNRDVIGELPKRGDIVDFWLVDDPCRTSGLIASEVHRRERES